MGIKTLLPFLKSVKDECNLDHFKDVTEAVDASYWLHKAISLSLSRFGDDPSKVCKSPGFSEGFLYLFVELSKFYIIHVLPE